MSFDCPLYRIFPTNEKSGMPIPTKTNVIWCERQNADYIVLLTEKIKYKEEKLCVIQNQCNVHRLQKKDGAGHGDNSNNNLDTIGNCGTLEILDSQGTGFVQGNGFSYCSPAVIQNFGGHLAIKGVHIDGGADRGAQAGQYVIMNDERDNTSYGGGVLIIDIALIYDSATFASLICSVVGTIAVKGDTDLIHGNTKTIRVKGGKVIMNGAKIKSNAIAISAEGGIVIINSLTITGAGVLTEAGGTIQDNR